MMHPGTLALSGAGLMVLESTAATPEGRIAYGDLGLWDELLFARGLPGFVVYLALAGLLVASQFAFPLSKTLPGASVAAMMALLAAGLYWLIAMFFLRSDPRAWRPDSAWYCANLVPLAAGERDGLALVVRGELAPRLQRELMIVTATGAAMGALDFGAAGMATAVVLAALCAWLAGLLLGLRRERARD